MLSKEFWNGLEKSYPGPVADFYKWLADYRLRADVMWNDLFYNSRRMYQVEIWDLPNAMQMGILIQYNVETSDTIWGNLFGLIKMDHLSGFVSLYFYERQQTEKTATGC